MNNQHILLGRGTASKELSPFSKKINSFLLVQNQWKKEKFISDNLKAVVPVLIIHSNMYIKTSEIHLPWLPLVFSHLYPPMTNVFQKKTLPMANVFQKEKKNSRNTSSMLEYQPLCLPPPGTSSHGTPTAADIPRTILGRYFAKCETKFRSTDEIEIYGNLGDFYFFL